jgi:hypothetical protein
MATIATQNDNGNGPLVCVVQQASPPLSVSEETSKEVAGVPPGEWTSTLRRWGVPYRRSGKLHVALVADVEKAIRDGAERRPGPKLRPKSEAEVPGVAGMLARAGYRRAR